MQQKAKSLAEFLIFGNYFISLAAAALALHTYQFLQMQVDLYLILIIFFSTLSVYCLHAFFKKLGSASVSRLLWIQNHKNLLLIQALLSGMASFILIFFYNGIMLIMSVLAIISFLYSLPRILNKSNRLLSGIIFLKTFYLTITWVLVTYCLPLILQQVTYSYKVILGLVARFLLILPLCMIFERKDLQESRIAGQRIFINQLSVSHNRILVISIFALMMVVTALVLGEGFNQHLVLSVAIPFVYLAIVYQTFKNSASDMTYYLLGDGVLFLPALMASIPLFFK